MELKLNTKNIIIIVNLSSNRTFMELKCSASTSFSWAALGSNRTFMELKFVILVRRDITMTEF